jgi:hypothetical protein
MEIASSKEHIDDLYGQLLNMKTLIFKRQENEGVNEDVSSGSPTKLIDDPSQMFASPVFTGEVKE